MTPRNIDDLESSISYIYIYIYITNVFPIEVGCRGFTVNSTFVFLTNLGLH